MKLLLAALIGLVVAYPCYAHPKEKDGKATKADYESVLDKMTKWSEYMSDPEFWKDTKLKNKKTGKVVAFGDLGEFERDAFYVTIAEKMTNDLKRFSILWQEESENYKEDKTDVKAASKEDVEKYRRRLMDLRKSSAKRYEKLSEKFFEDHKDKFTQKQRDSMFKNIREWHDKENLIERK